VRERLHERRARPTLDTPEHRWLAARLDDVRRRLGRVRREESRRAGGARLAATLAELDALEERVVRLARLEPLAAATRPPPPGFASLQLLSAPGYREAYRASLALAQALGVEGGPLELTLKELHLLYEYWCFLTLVRVLAAELGLPAPARQLLAAEPRGLRVRLQRGTEHTVVLNAPGGRRVTATYNPSFRGGALLVPQRPDVLLGVHDPGRPARYAVLDAKYRLDASGAYLRRYGAPGPPEEALNDLHRYRDAIARPDAPAERLVARAAALFPYREAEPGSFRAARHWRSLGELGVGAIPLLPDATGYLAEWLGSFLAS
jgi:hypothetical protein